MSRIILFTTLALAIVSVAMVIYVAIRDARADARRAAEVEAYRNEVFRRCVQQGHTIVSVTYGDGYGYRSCEKGCSS